MVVKFTKIGDFDFFHIDNCMADNKLATDDVNYASVQMVESGCLVDKFWVIKWVKKIEKILNSFQNHFWFGADRISDLWILGVVRFSKITMQKKNNFVWL